MLGYYIPKGKRQRPWFIFESKEMKGEAKIITMQSGQNGLAETQGPILYQQTISKAN